MSMVKLVSPSGWNFDGPVVSLVKVARDGRLRGHDRQEFIKRAGEAAPVFLAGMDRVKLAADEEYAHVLGLGASEFWGGNRNGDGFREPTLLRTHPTFEKFARAYRNHQNKNPKKSYGVIKLAAYHPSMHRVELLIGYNREKSAADRNGGLIADRELQKLASDTPMAVSMACRVSHDVCSWCKHAAKTRDEYCKEASCGAGGCAKNLAKLVKVAGDLHHLHVDNPDPTFFDLSDVFKPADRTAYGAKADWLEKAAADLGFFGDDGVKLAREVELYVPLDVCMHQAVQSVGEDSDVGLQIKVAHGLAAIEDNPQHRAPASLQRAFASRMQPAIDYGTLGLEGTNAEKRAAVLGALAERMIVLPLSRFAEMTKRAEHLSGAAQALPGVYYRLLVSDNLAETLTANPYVPNTKLASFAERTAADQLTTHYSLRPEVVDRRAQLGAVRGVVLPTASTREKTAAATSPESEQLVRDYAAYTLAALTKIAAAGTDFAKVAKLVVSQNYATCFANGA